MHNNSLATLCTQSLPASMPDVRMLMHQRDNCLKACHKPLPAQTLLFSADDSETELCVEELVQVLTAYPQPCDC
jgi:hypothetical protein